jgi:hypothetical protein
MIDLRDMMGYNKRSSKEPKKHLKTNGDLFTPESSTRKSPHLLSKPLPATREDIANDSSINSELSPSQLSAFLSPVPADTLLDDSEKCQIIIKKHGKPPKDKKKEMLQLLSNMLSGKAHTTEKLMSTLMRYIIKMFWILGINQL